MAPYYNPNQSDRNPGQCPPPPYGNPNPGIGYGPGQESPQWLANDFFASGPEGKSRGITALLCFFLGSLGVHYFYTGKIAGGVIMILITLFTCGTVSSILVLIQFIMLCCMNNQEFRRKYILSNSTMPF